MAGSAGMVVHTHTTTVTLAVHAGEGIYRFKTKLCMKRHHFKSYISPIIVPFTHHGISRFQGLYSISFSAILASTEGIHY